MSEPDPREHPDRSRPRPSRITRRPGRPAGGLGERLHRSFRPLLTGVVLVTLVLAVLSWSLLAHLHPRIGEDAAALRSLRESHAAITDQRMAITGWLATDDPRALVRSRLAERQAAEALDGLAGRLGRAPELDRALLDLMLAHQAWQLGWVAQVTAVGTPPSGPERAGAIGADEDLFVRYRRAHEHAVDVALARQRDRLAAEHAVVIVGFGAAGLVAVGMAVAARRARRRLERSVTEPVAELRAAMDRLAAGEHPDVADLDGPVELLQLAAGLERTAEQLLADHEELVAERERTHRHAETMRTILDVARQIAGSLNVRYVAEALAEAAHRISSAGRVVVWLTDRAELVAIHDSTLPRGTVPELPPLPISEAGVGDVGVASIARDARPEPIAGVTPGYGFPLVVGGRVVGVLELADAIDGVAPAELEPLETLAVHGAAALEAARLHRAAEDLAQIDALTQLPNRRRLDDDLATEVDRAERYGRPLALVMLDIDHFKQLNDTYGHVYGDEVLRLVGESLRAHLRSSDTAYRYGGEEFCVLLRDSDVEAAVTLAERLRAELGRDLAGETAARITASFGVSALPQHARGAAELVAAADQALYAAKRGGRDRVEVAGPVAARQAVAATV